MKQNEIEEIEGEVWVSCKHINNDGVVLNFTGLYEVSNLGRVRSLNYNKTGKVRIMSPYTSEGKDGSIFYKVCLRKDCKQYTKSVHRLVLSSFDQEGWSPNDVVDHVVPRTSNNCNNCLNNLRWFSQKENSNTEHCIEARSKSLRGHPALINRTDQSKSVRVINLTTSETMIYPSTREAERSLGLPHLTVSFYIRRYKGLYKKRQLLFEYIE